MFRSNPEITIICVGVGIILIVRGWHALKRNAITVKKPIGFPWQYSEVKADQNPRLFFFTTWGMIVLGILFMLFPFLIEYLI